MAAENSVLNQMAGDFHNAFNDKKMSWINVPGSAEIVG